MKKILSAIPTVYYLLIFALSLESLISLGIARNLAIFFIVPTFVMLVLNLVFLFKKVTSTDFEGVIAVLNTLIFTLLFIVFGVLSWTNIFVFIVVLIPLVASVMHFVILIRR